MRHVRRLGCPSGKWAYDTEHYALRGLKYKRKHGEIKQGHVYKCKQCPGFHLTSNERSHRKMGGLKNERAQDQYPSQLRAEAQRRTSRGQSAPGG